MLYRTNNIEMGDIFFLIGLGEIDSITIWKNGRRDVCIIGATVSVRDAVVCLSSLLAGKIKYKSSEIESVEYNLR